MNADQLCRQYLDAVEASDLEAVLAIFTDTARVVSPLYGSQPADLFFANVFGDTQQSKATLIRIMTSPAPDNAIALQFEYSWTLSSGALVEFEVVNILEVNDAGQIDKLTVLYDTAPLRTAHEEAARQREPAA